MSRRSIAALVLAGATIAGLVADRHRPSVAVATFGRPGISSTAALAPLPDTLASTWFCPGVPAVPDNSASGTIDLANEADTARVATITVFAAAPSGAAPVAKQIPLGARTRTSVRLADLVTAPYAAALVEVPDAVVYVEQTVSGPLGTDHQPCATTAATQWLAASGATTLDATYALLAFNPFQDPAVMDVTFLTTEGTRTPQGLQGLVVPARSLVVIAVNEQVLRSSQVASEVNVRSGRVVMGRSQRYDGTAGRKGTVSGLLATGAGPDWWFADGAAGPGVHETVVVANPGAHDTNVQVAVSTDPSSPPVTPLTSTVPAGGVVAVDLNAVPAGRHSLTVRSLDATPVVVERRIDVTDAAHLSTSSTLGSRILATRWDFVAGDVAAGAHEEIIVTNPTAIAVSVTVSAIAATGTTPLAGAAGVAVPPGGALRVTPTGLAAGPIPLIVTASAPLVAERLIVADDGPTASRTVGIATVALATGSR